MIQKIAYIIYTNEDSTGGVIKKVFTTLGTWRKLGIKSKLFILTSNPNLQNELSLLYEKGYFKTYLFRSILNRIKQFNKLVTDVIKYNPTMVYYRFQMFLPDYIKLTKMFPLIIEVNTNDVIERKLHSQGNYIINKYLRNITFDRCNGIVYVSPELPKAKDFSKYKKPFIVLGNSIDTNLIQPLEPTNNKIPQLVFMGNSNHPWQGLDKINIFAELFPEWVFHIIGFNNISKKNSPPNIKYHGYLELNKYKEIMKKADCSIGTMALHRKHMDSTSALKVLEYLAFGLPVILAYSDINIPTNAPYILQLPNIENNIIPNKNNIKSFVNSWLNKRVSPKIAKMFDTIEIETKRIKFFDLIIKNK